MTYSDQYKAWRDTIKHSNSALCKRIDEIADDIDLDTIMSDDYDWEVGYTTEEITNAFVNGYETIDGVRLYDMPEFNSVMEDLWDVVDIYEIIAETIRDEKRYDRKFS